MHIPHPPLYLKHFILLLTSEINDLYRVTIVLLTCFVTTVDWETFAVK